MKPLPEGKKRGAIVHVQDGDSWHVGPSPCKSGTHTHLTPSQCLCRWYPNEETALEAVAAWPDHNLTPYSAHTITSDWDHLSDLVGHWWTEQHDSMTLYRLDVLTSVREHAELMTARLVTRARAQGHSWSKIGQQLGMTKQAAQQKYGVKATAKLDPDQLTLTSE